MRKPLSEWDKGAMQGYMAALSGIIAGHGIDTTIEEAYECNYCTIAELRRYGVDEYDINLLRPVVKAVKDKRKTQERITKRKRMEGGA